jgi:hypothetical protein
MFGLELRRDVSDRTFGHLRRECGNQFGSDDRDLRAAAHQQFDFARGHFTASDY